MKILPIDQNNRTKALLSDSKKEVNETQRFIYAVYKKRMFFYDMWAN